MTAAALSWRGPGPGRPEGIPLPPDRMPLLRSGRPLKRWRYVAVYGPELSACVCSVQVGPARQGFWAVWDRAAGRLHERTRMGRAGIELGPGSARVHQPGIELDLTHPETAGVEVVCPNGRAYAWTRKQAGIPVRGRLRLDGGEQREIAGEGVIDDSAGYHARHTAWRWSAGVGSAEDGTPVAWNLVEGMNDPPHRSERAVWRGGEPAEVGPVRFAPDLSSIAFAEGGELRFASEAVRRRSDNLLVFSSDYEQPFGTFAGTLPGGARLAEGFGVMERHRARW
jgi:Protein of unknown function (DUF2804)